ncbi:MAG: MoxR family ATPase [Planctomycetes bacterium]|nr:MoxR family ATPase [Planctomycetota bacterium]
MSAERVPPDLPPEEIAGRLEAAIARAVRGKSDVIRLLLTALFCRGHVLVEDVPGVGKTTLARALARAVGGSFRRIQFTSDLLPSDILGVSVFSQASGSFEFKPGPIFANVVLADEINRTTPRTQSALLEAMGEGQVTVDARTLPLEDPFLVVATQNPIEFFGTYPLPESQLDRFLLRLTMGYPAPDEERRLVAERGGDDPVRAIEPVVSFPQILAVQREVDRVRTDPALLDYVMAVVGQTRRHGAFALGVSPRGAIQWYRAAQGYALLSGRRHVLPDDLKALAIPVLAHRVVLASPHAADGKGREESEAAIRDVLDQMPVPV